MYDVQEPAPTPRPLIAIDLPKQAARNNLHKRLVEDFSLDDRAARAISQAVVDPAAARAVLKTPLEIAVRHGVVKVIRTPVFTPMSTVSPINPRIGNQRGVIEGAAGSDGKPLRYFPSGDGEPLLVLNCASPDELRDRISNAATEVRTVANPELHHPIFHQGVPQALTLFCARAEHRDGSPDEVFLLAADGSSRTAHAQHIIGMDNGASVYRWPNASAQEWNGFLGRIVKTQERPEHEVTDRDLAQHRSLVVMADIVVAIEPLPGEVLDAEEAYRSLIGGLHVTRPKQWGTVWENQTIAEAVLKSMREAGVITSTESDFMEGVSPAAASVLGYSENMDERAARILEKLMARSAREAFAEGYLTIVNNKSRLANNDRSNIAAALMMEGYAGTLSEPRLKTVRSVLERGLWLTEFRDGSFEVSGLNPDDLLADGLRSLQSDPDVISAPAKELAVMALYWMAQKGGLKRETKSTGNAGPSEILKTMMGSPRGLRQLHRAVVDGRTGRSEILLVDEAGDTVLDATREPVVATDDAIRRQFGDHPEEEQPEQEDRRRPASGPPAARVAAAVETLKSRVRHVRNTIAEIEEITLGATPYVAARGVQAGTVQEMTDDLNMVSGKLQYWKTVNQIYLDSVDDRGGEAEEQSPDGTALEDAEVAA